MNDLTRISAVFEIQAGAVGDCEIDITGLTPDEIAELVEYAADVNASLCHQCAHDISDLSVGEMTSFTVNNVDYENVDGRWVAQS